MMFVLPLIFMMSSQPPPSVVWSQYILVGCDTIDVRPPVTPTHDLNRPHSLCRSYHAVVVDEVDAVDPAIRRCVADVRAARRRNGRVVTKT